MMMIRGFCHVVELGAVLSLSAQFSKSSMGGGATQLGPAPAVEGKGNGAVHKLRWSLGPSTHLVIQKGDLTKWFVDHSSDAIVSDLKCFIAALLSFLLFFFFSFFAPLLAPYV